MLRYRAASAPPSGFRSAPITSGHGGNLLPRRPDTPRAAAIFTIRRFSGVLPPACPAPTGHNPLLPLLPSLPLSGKFGVLSPTRRTSPVMTNKRIKSVLELMRNAAVMASPSAHHYPAERPAILSVSLPLHLDPLFDPSPNAKTREAQGLAGFGPGAFFPLTFLLCHK